MPAAIEHAEWLTEIHWKFEGGNIWEKNPYTDVYKIIQKIEALTRRDDNGV